MVSVRSCPAEDSRLWGCFRLVLESFCCLPRVSDEDACVSSSSVFRRFFVPSASVDVRFWPADFGLDVEAFVNIVGDALWEGFLGGEVCDDAGSGWAS